MIFSETLHVLASSDFFTRWRSNPVSVLSLKVQAAVFNDIFFGGLEIAWNILLASRGSIYRGEISQEMEHE